MLCFSFSVNVYKVTGQFPWSSLRETDRGVSTEFNVSVAQVLHTHFSWVLAHIWFAFWMMESLVHRADFSLFERGQWFENDRGCASSTFWYNSISFWPYKNASMFFFIFFLNYHFREAGGCLAYDISPIQVIFHLECINQCASNSWLEQN